MRHLIVPIALIFLCSACVRNTSQPPVKNKEEQPHAAQHTPVNENEQEDVSIVLFDAQSKQWSIKNKKRAEQAYLPASTFKILHTLIALQSGVVKKDEVFKWDGTKHRPKAWNKDQTLESAFRHSVIWVYQIIAKRIGRERMQNYITLSEYGNQAMGKRLDSFWLDGDLRITARQQINFLRQLQGRTLPFSTAHMDYVEKIMVRKNGQGWRMKAKSGWAQRVTPQYGWFVGWIEKKEKRWFFATNVAITSRSDAKKRMEKTLSTFREQKIIPME